MKQLISPKELAEALGVPLATVYKWSSEGSGPPALRIGKHLRYDEDDVAAWLDSRRNAA